MSDENQSAENHQDHQSPPRKKRKRLVRSVKSRPESNAAPDAEACLNALGQLPGLIAMKLVTTAQANAIRGVYGTILQQYQRSRTGRDQSQLDDADVMEILRGNPSLLSMLAPLLTDEQIDAVMGELKEDEDGQT